MCRADWFGLYWRKLRARLDELTALAGLEQWYTVGLLQQRVMHELSVGERRRTNGKLECFKPTYGQLHQVNPPQCFGATERSCRLLPRCNHAYELRNLQEHLRSVYVSASSRFFRYHGIDPAAADQSSGCSAISNLFYLLSYGPVILFVQDELARHLPAHTHCSSLRYFPTI